VVVEEEEEEDDEDEQPLRKRIRKAPTNNNEFSTDFRHVCKYRCRSCFWVACLCGV